jgi:hypothetical protein
MVASTARSTSAAVLSGTLRDFCLRRGIEDRNPLSFLIRRGKILGMS